VLTEKEKAVVKRVSGKNSMGVKELTSIPYYYFFNTSYFPNNMLDTRELTTAQSKKLLKSFRKLLKQKDVTEREVMQFIRRNRAYFIVASVLCNYDFGHHGAFLFPEFPLSTNFVADYLVIGKNSGGHEFVFVEVESVYGSITTKDGAFGECIRKGVKQVEDWQFWLEKNFRNLNAQFDKYRNKDEALPSEFLEFDHTRIHHVVIAGRREHYNEETYRKRRKLFMDSDIRLLHYDNLIDCAKSVLSSGNYV